MSILAVDTATAYCSAAFGAASAGVEAPTGHAEHLAELIRRVVPSMDRIGNAPTVRSRQ